MNLLYLISFNTIIIWCIFVYFIGILTKYLNLNIFEIHLFLTVLSIYGFFSSLITMLFDKNHPKNILHNLYNLNFKDKFYIFISCLPVSKLIVISYIDLDPVIIQLLNNTSIVINIIFAILYNKTYYLFDKIIIINMIINVISSIIPFIFNDNFSIKINNNTIFGLIGLINTFISLILNGIVNVVGANIKNIENNGETIAFHNTFIIFTFMLLECISYIILIPFIYYK